MVDVASEAVPAQTEPRTIAHLGQIVAGARPKDTGPG